MRKKVTKNINQLGKRLLVFGGVYSNLQALQQMQNIAKDLGIPAENIICTGDVVGYCAQPEECVQAVIDWGIHCIAGNVEIQLREGEEDCGCNFDEGGRCNLFSRQWYPYAQSQLSKTSINWMKTLPDFFRFQYGKYKAFVLHGSFHETSEFIFASTPWSIKQNNFTDTQSSLILAGHCGLPFNQIRGHQYWLNAGVIGMPANDGNTEVWYLLLDFLPDGTISYRHHSYAYDFSTAAELMRENHLPSAYAHTLETGIWDNCEILPEQETALQGKTLSF
ncbi:MAG: metallophosphoesterase family protein [Bacteroidota bacterium]